MMALLSPRLWLALAIAGLLALLGVQQLRVKSAQTETAGVQSAFDAFRAQVADLAAKSAIAHAAAQAAQEAQLSQMDTQRTKEKDDAMHQNDSLRAAVGAGTQRLRIAGSCVAARGGDVPQAATSASVGTAPAVELAPTTGRAVFDLRAALIADRAQLLALQDYAARVCKGGD